MLKPTAVPSLFPASPDPRGQDPMPRKKRLKRTQGETTLAPIQVKILGTSNADSSQEERASAEPGEVYSSENPIETAQEAEWLHFPSSQDNMEDCSSVIQGEHQKRPVRRSMTSQTSIGLKKMRSLVAATKTLRRKCSRLKEMNSNLHSQLEKLKKDFFEMKALAEANGALTLQVRSYVSGRMLY
ncbi:hypothetical protein MRX96_048578 [Rhipicephalus microplus]|nr:uncharacterized protein LOC119176236 [Rhipicephalus microplus]